MALVSGDTHGNHSRLKAFLQYKPEEEHILTGDLMDSYVATDEGIIETFQLFQKSNALATWSNHDCVYLKNCPGQLMCSGHRYNPAFGHLINGSKDKYRGSFIRDGYLITHAGVVEEIGSRFSDLESLSEYINTEIDKIVYNPEIWVESPLSDVFNISTRRGGYHKYGGPLWADYRSEWYDYRINQVFGHSHSDLLKIFTYGEGKSERKHVAVDCKEFSCFNTKTGAAEDFMFPEFKDDLVVRKMLEVGF